MLSSMCEDVARLQFDSSSEKDILFRISTTERGDLCALQNGFRCRYVMEKRAVYSLFVAAIFFFSQSTEFR